MSFIAWFFIGYGVVAILAIRPIAGALAWRMHRNDTYKRGRPDPSGEQWFGAIGSALVIVCFWPVAVAFVLQGRSDTWTVGAERLARIEEREQRIERLERELELTR